MAIDGVADAKVMVDIESGSAQGSKGVGKIKNVVVYIEPGITADERKVTTVTIGPKVLESAKESGKLSTAVVDKAKRAVTELYQLRSSQVDIKRMN
jgi:stage III sporulation protein AF